MTSEWEGVVRRMIGRVWERNRSGHREGEWTGKERSKAGAERGQGRAEPVPVHLL